MLAAISPLNRQDPETMVSAPVVRISGRVSKLTTFFYAVTMTYGVIALVLETAIYLLLCKVIKTHVTDSAKQ